MAAVFEINILYKKYIPISSIINSINELKKTCVIEKMFSMNDWRYTNVEKIRENNETYIERLIDSKKIVVIEGIIDSTYRCGISYQKLQMGQYSIECWISTLGLEELDNNYITSKNINKYSLLISHLTEFFDENELILCGMGAEVFWAESLMIEDVLHGSKNISVWIFPRAQQFEELKNYKRKYDKNFIIYMKTNPNI